MIAVTPTLDSFDAVVLLVAVTHALTTMLQTSLCSNGECPNQGNGELGIHCMLNMILSFPAYVYVEQIKKDDRENGCTGLVLRIVLSKGAEKTECAEDFFGWQIVRAE